MSLSTRIRSWRKYPIVLAGFDIRRWEGANEGALYLPAFAKKLLFFYSEAKAGLGPTHLQYASPFGFLITWPFCIHVWIQFRPQMPGVPGSEVVAYARLGARWEAEQDVYVFPSLYVGGHWD